MCIFKKDSLTSEFVKDVSNSDSTFPGETGSDLRVFLTLKECVSRGVLLRGRR